jgi:hypothetical protein
MPVSIRRLALGLGLLPALLLSGCLYVSASGSFGPDLDPAVVARIVPGQTTKAELLAWLGPPDEFLRSEVLGALGDDTTRVSEAVALGNRAQDAFTYQHERLSGVGNVLLLYNRIRARLESDLLVVFFDADDRVREVGFRRRTETP